MYNLYIDEIYRPGAIFYCRYYTSIFIHFYTAILGKSIA